MSLLLDALKKAANEKKKVAETAENVTGKHNATANKNEKVDSIDDFDLSLDEDALQDVAEKGEQITAYQDEFQTGSQKEGSEKNREEGAGDSQEDYERLSQVVSANTDKNIADAPDGNGSVGKTQTDKVIRAPDRAGGNLDYDVSDEALDLLIRKSNRSYRKNKVIWVVLASILSLTVLVAGGVYFTEKMQSEIEFLETRYKQSIRLIREKTSNESLPDKSVIIENLIGDEDLSKKVEFTKARLAKEKNQQAFNAKQEKAKQKQRADKINNDASSAQEYVRKSVLSIEKSQHADPVSLLLDEAWLAYEEDDFIRADKAYEKVLRMERNNRDALLGRGAIALQNKLFAQAKGFYLALMEINPRDPEATSALTSLAQTSNQGTGQVGQALIEKEQAIKSERYLKNLLQKNEQSPVLNFSLGSIYAGQKRWKLAQESFFKAWVNDNKNPGYAYNLAVSLDQIGKANEAKRFYQTCLQLSENKKVQFSKQSVLNRIAQIN